jgi:phospholipase C
MGTTSVTKQVEKHAQKCLIDNGIHRWREQTPDLAIPMQPRLLDAMQREILDGSVHVDPDPAQQDTRNGLRILGVPLKPSTLYASRWQRLEHNIASRGGELPTASAYNELPLVSPGAHR